MEKKDFEKTFEKVAELNKRVVGFSVYKYNMDYLNGLSPKYLYGLSLKHLYELSPKHLYELACEDEDAVIYDSVDIFFNELNCDLVDTENYLWFLA